MEKRFCELTTREQLCERRYLWEKLMDEANERFLLMIVDNQTRYGLSEREFLALPPDVKAIVTEKWTEHCAITRRAYATHLGE
jgi:hypothetical protein